MHESLNWLEMPWESCRCGQGLYVLSGRGAALHAPIPAREVAGSRVPACPPPGFSAHQHRNTATPGHTVLPSPRPTGLTELPAR